MKFKIYQAHHGWRWQLKGSNGRIIAASSQAFSSKQAAKNNAKLTRDRLASIPNRKWRML